MHPEIKVLWLEALRSREYLQGTGSLCDVSDPENPRYCCLGVLTHLAVKAGILQSGIPDQDELHFDGSAGYLPASVKFWAGLESVNPFIEEEGASLAGLNDDGNHDFFMIAETIERHL